MKAGDDSLPFLHVTGDDGAVDWRNNGGVTQVQFRRRQGGLGLVNLCLRQIHLCFGIAIVGSRQIQIRLGDELLLPQRSHAIEFECSLCEHVPGFG